MAGGLARQAAGLGRSSHYRWLDQNPDYRKAFELAREVAADRLEAEAFRRAVEGVERPIGWYKGKPGGYTREYSDVLLILLLKGLRPDVYRDRVNGRGMLSKINLDQLSDAQLSRIAAGVHPMAVLAGGLHPVRRTTNDGQGTNTE